MIYIVIFIALTTTGIALLLYSSVKHVEKNSIKLEKICKNLRLQIVSIPGPTETYVIRHIKEDTSEVFYLHKPNYIYDLSIIKSKTGLKPAYSLGENNYFWSGADANKINEGFVHYDSIEKAKSAILKYFDGFSRSNKAEILLGFNSENSNLSVSTVSDTDVDKEKTVSTTKIISEMLVAEQKGDKEKENELLDLFESSQKQVKNKIKR